MGAWRLQKIREQFDAHQEALNQQANGGRISRILRRLSDKVFPPLIIGDAAPVSYGLVEVQSDGLKADEAIQIISNQTEGRELRTGLTRL